MKSQSSFVRTNGRVHFNPIPAVYLYFFVIVYPCNTKGHHSLRFCDPQEDVLTVIYIVLDDVGNHGLGHFRNRLHKLGFVLISSIYFCKKLRDDIFHKTLGFVTIEDSFFFLKKRARKENQLGFLL